MNNDIEKIHRFSSRKEAYLYLEPYFLSRESIAREAYYIWEQDGKPDGEQLIESPLWWKGTKIKDYHWMFAEMRLETALDMDADTLFCLDSDPDFKWTDESSIQVQLKYTHD